MKFLKSKFLFVFLGVMFGIIVLDLITKKALDDVSYSVIGDVLWFQSTTNTGASFGALKGMGWLFIVLGFLAFGACLYIVFFDKVSESAFFKTSIAVLSAGIMGNLVDRIVFGYVRDFIYLKFIDFAIFNVADMAITIGTALLVIYILFLHKEKEKKETVK